MLQDSLVQSNKPEWIEKRWVALFIIFLILIPSTVKANVIDTNINTIQNK